MLTSIFRSSLTRRTIALAILALTLCTTGAQSATVTYKEGCMDQWMFNGVWRVRVTKVEPSMDGTQQNGWLVTESWRNGTNQELAPGDSVLTDQVLELADGTKIAASANNTGWMSMGTMSSHTFAPAAQFTYVQHFWAANVDPAVKPKSVTITFDDNKLKQFTSKPQFSTAQYDFRIKLDCQATGAQAAEGGSFEIVGAKGCMNQYMSNGLWRMRATAIEPYNGTGGPQTGWTITEQWVSLAHAPIAPGDTNITDQQLALADGDTIASSSGVTSMGSFGQLAMHTFAPQSSFTYKQYFLQIPLDPTNKPAKLIVTFDAVKQRLATARPQYPVIPPNFRIDLTCTR